jgi:predicted TIM-barrel fold metal-dependent hydrolase
VSSELEARPRYRRFDAHAHIQPAATAEALEFYRSHGVEAAVNVSGRFPGYGLEEAAAAARNSAGRMFFMCNIPWQIPVDHPRFLELGRLALQRCRDVGGVGWKIHKVLGLGATYIDGRLVPVDAPELDPLFELAGQLGLPVLMHVGDPQAFFRPPTPDNERYEELRAHPGWSFFGPEFPSWEEIFAQFERRVARHRRVTFIGAHFGNAPEEPRRVGQMLERYSNYFIDTAARIPEIGRHDPQLMHDFFVRHQDRILFASDLGYGRGWGGRLLSLGSSGEEPPQAEDIERFWQATYRYFETDERDFAHPTPIQGRWTISGIALPPPVLRKLYHENAERVLGVSLP